MRLFTPRQFKKPSEWLRAIPLLQDELKRSLPLHPDTLEYIRAIFNTLDTLILIQERLKKEIDNLNENQEELLYPVRLTRDQFSVVEQLLYTNWLKTGY